jgi:hypothetical protein
MKASALVLVAVVACGHGAEDAAITTPLRKPERIVTGVPPGGFINAVALTEQADAALTIDTLNELRLWPSLDGKRQPIPIPAQGIAAIALGHAGDELLASLLDQAGAVKLLRIGRDGVIHAKVQLPGDVAIEQIDAIDNGVLVMRVDQSIERYSADGKLLGRLVAGPGEKLGALAVRHGNAAVLIVGTDPGPDDDKHEVKVVPPTFAAPEPELASMLRWIVIGDDLRWGTSIKLPTQIDSHVLALSPNHHRIGVIDARMMVVEVFDLDPLPNHHAGPTLTASITDPIGFADDDHLAITQNAVQWWTAPTVKPDHDPWDVQPQIPEAMAPGGTGGAIGDGLVVSGFGSSLALSDYKGARYLGWKNVGTGVTTALGSRIALMTSTTHVLWLDDRLAQQGESDVTDLPGSTPQYSIWLDPHHVIVERAVGDRYKIDLLDTQHVDKPIAIGTFAFVERLEYEPELHAVMIGTSGELARFVLDVDHDTATALPTLKTSTQVQAVHLVDPARANGTIAVVTTYDDDGQRIVLYREPKAAAKLVKPTKSFSVESQVVIGSDNTGTVFLRTPTGIESKRDGKTVTKFPPELIADSITASHDASQLAVIHGNELVMVDAKGTERWRKPVWGAVTVVFTTDNRRLVVRTSGGVVSLDAATGERIAAVCGYGFGIEDKAPPVNALGVTPVCED